MKRIYLLLALLPLFLVTACNDDDLEPRRNETDLEALNRLAPITQNGANTFGCLVNGEVWIPETSGPGNGGNYAIDATIGVTDPSNMTITARAEPISTDRDQVLKIGTVYSIGMKTSMKTWVNFNDRNFPMNTCHFIEIDTTLENYIIVDFVDAERQILSGRFACTYQEPDCPEQRIEITEGRFDVIYRY